MGASSDPNTKHQKRSEIYTNEAPRHIYAMNWGICDDKKYRLTIASQLDHPTTITIRVEIVQLDNSTGKNQADPNLSFDHPNPPTKTAFVLDKECQHANLLATSSDFISIWQIAGDSSRIELRSFLNGNKNREFCRPPTSFDWNEAEPKCIGTSGIDTTCTIQDIEHKTVDTQLITP